MVSRAVQIRNVPEHLHRKMKARAARAGMSLSDYLLGIIRRAADRPTREELLERITRRAPVRTRERPAAAVRAGREAG